MADVAQDPRLIAMLAGTNPQAYADLLVKQRQLARQQQLAQGLMQQAVTPTPNEEVSGRVVKYGMGQGLSRLAEALLTRNLNNRNDQTASDLGQQQGALYSSAMDQQLQKIASYLHLGQGTPAPAPASADGSPSAGQGQPTVVPPPTDPQSPAAGQQDPTSYGHISPDVSSGQSQQGPQPSPQALAQQLSTNPQPQPAQGSYGPGALDPRQLVMGGAGLSMSPFFGDMGKEMVKQGIGSMLPTELARNNAYQGITPDMQRAITMAKAAHDAQLTLDPGKAYANLLTGQSGFVPQIPANAQPATPYNPLANGGAMGAVAPVQNAQGVEQGNAYATASGKAGGKLPFEMVQGTTPAGTPFTAPYGALAGGLPPAGNPAHPVVSPADQKARDAESIQLLQEELAKPGLPVDQRVGLQRELARMMASQGQPGFPTPTIVSSVPAGAVQSGRNPADAKVADQVASTIATAPADIQQSRGAINGLESALRELEALKASGGTTGPGTARRAQVVAIINNAMGSNIDANDVNAYQKIGKLLANSASSVASGSSAGGSDGRFEQFMHGQPNTDTLNIDPLISATRYVLAQHDQSVASKQTLLNAYKDAQMRGDPNAPLTAATAAATKVNPQFFTFNRMTPQEQVQFLKSQPNPKAWRDSYNKYAQETGWVK